MANLLRRISKELKVEPEDILDVIKKLSNSEELGRKEKQIENLEKEKINL